MVDYQLTLFNLFQRDAALALLELTRKLDATGGTSDCMPEQPTKTVYLGAQVGLQGLA